MALIVLSLCPFDISAGVGVFVIGLSQISSFFLYEDDFVWCSSSWGKKVAATVSFKFWRLLWSYQRRTVNYFLVYTETEVLVNGTASLLYPTSMWSLPYCCSYGPQLFTLVPLSWMEHMLIMISPKTLTKWRMLSTCLPPWCWIAFSRFRKEVENVLANQK